MADEILYPEIRKRALLKFLMKYQEKNGFSPTLKEIGAHFGYSKQRAWQLLRSLKKDKKIKIKKSTSRGIQPIEA